MTTGRVQPTTKFFSNKIQSTESNWADYLIEVADVFSHFDGLPYDRAAIVHEFENLTDRGPYVVRDPSDFRDEYSAYGSYLGIYYIDHQNGQWVTRLTRAARAFLCSTEPDPAAFCRVQLSLFQYPCGLGVSYAQNGKPNRVQSNALKDTVQDVMNNVCLVPLRVVLRAFLALIDQGQDPADIVLNFNTIFNLFNEQRLYENSRVSPADTASAVRESMAARIPAGVDMSLFKRNFHIMVQTGLLRRTSGQGGGLALELGPTGNTASTTLNMCRTIASIPDFYDQFNACATTANIEECVKNEILNLGWGRYYDGGNLPGGILAVLAPSPSSGNQAILVRDAATPAFPSLEEYQPSAARPRPAPLMGAGTPTDPEQTRILREKANRAHARLIKMLATRLRTSGMVPQDNIYIDLFTPEAGLIIEVKSCNQGNMLSQVRRGVSQLYEYRYRLGKPEMRLCLAMEEEPRGQNSWLVDYLLGDRGIYPLWIEGDVSLNGPPETQRACHFIVLG